MIWSGKAPRFVCHAIGMKAQQLKGEHKSMLEDRSPNSKQAQWTRPGNETVRERKSAKAEVRAGEGGPCSRDFFSPSAPPSKFLQLRRFHIFPITTHSISPCSVPV